MPAKPSRRSQLAREDRVLSCEGSKKLLKIRREYKEDMNICEEDESSQSPPRKFRDRPQQRAKRDVLDQEMYSMLSLLVYERTISNPDNNAQRIKKIMNAEFSAHPKYLLIFEKLIENSTKRTLFLILDSDKRILLVEQIVYEAKID